MDLSMSSREDPFAPDSIFSQQDLPVVPNDNPESYCRLCLTTPDVVPLFPTDSDPNEIVLELIGKYIGVALTIQDDSPCSVCNSCQMILDQFDLFRQNCLKVDIAIRRRRLGLDRVVKSEPQDDENLEELELPYIRLENRVYQCRLCSETFRSMALFMVHCKEEHPDEAKMYKCKHCSKSFMSKTARLQHMRSHRPSNSELDLGGLRVQVCERCMVTFDSYKLLKVHIKEHHSNEPKQDTLVCNTCSRQFSRITILRNHILRVHMGKLPHVCKHCEISFGYTQQLVAHLKSEHGISPDQYGLFPDEDFEPEESIPPVSPVPSIPAPASLEDHQPPPVLEPVTDDSDRKPVNKYTCMECRVQCYSQDELRTHRKIHQDPTWWKCTLCRNFVKHREMHLLKKHPTISESEMDSSFMLRYRCWMCRMYFKSLHLMEVHANIKHQVPLPDHHQAPPPSDELEEGEIRPGVPMGAPPPPAPPMMPPLLTMAMTGMQQPLTAQPPLPIIPENFPLLLSQLENGAMDYLREFSRLIDPTNALGFAGPLNIKSEPMDTSQSVMDLSGGSALNMTLSSTVTDQEDNHDGDDESEDDTFVRLDNRTYQCKFCSEIFRHLQQIRKHTKMQHPSEWKSFKCVHCKRRFPSGPMRDRHVHFHSLNHPFKCTDCDQMYRSKKRLEKHSEVFHNRSSPNFSLERFNCTPCKLAFVEKKYFDLHSRIYHEKKPQRLKNLSDKIQVCEKCVKIFDSRDLLMEHIREAHQGDPPLKSCICQTCSKDLKTVTLLRIHILVVHLGIMPFVCQHCNAEFATRHWLLKHMEKEHSEIALYRCPSCDESFTTESRMIEHKDKSHSQLEIEFDPQSGKPVYPCGKCEKKLESKDLLDKHLLKAHPSFMLMYKCPQCPQSVRYRKQHMRVHHDVEYDEQEHSYQVRYKCHCCSKLFLQKRHLLAHQNSLSNQCSRCQMRFKTKKLLQAHMAAHRGSRSLKCEDCGLDFGYRGRLEEHRKRYHSATSTQVLKIINCPYCPKLFISPSNRERHIVANHVQSEFKVNCNHCSLQVTETNQLRKHYKEVHPEERVTFKCPEPECEKFYLNLSSFKDHCKKHKKEDGANEKAANNSTSEVVEDGEKKSAQLNEQNVDGGLDSKVEKDETNIQSENAAATVQNPDDASLNAGETSENEKKMPSDETTAAAADNLADGKDSSSSNAGEPSEELTKMEIQPELSINETAAPKDDLNEGKESTPGVPSEDQMKMEIQTELPNNETAATTDDLAAGKESTSSSAGEPSESQTKLENQTETTHNDLVPEESTKRQAPVVEKQIIDSIEAKEESSILEPVTTELAEPSTEQQPIVEESISEGKPVLLAAEGQMHLEKMVVEEAIDKPAAETKCENPVTIDNVEEKMEVDEPKVDENMIIEETAQLATNESTATVQPEQDIPQENLPVVVEEPTVEEPKPDEKMEVDEKLSCTSTSEDHPQKEITAEQVTDEQEKTNAEEETVSKPAEDVEPEQETASESTSLKEPEPDTEEPKPNDATEDLDSESATVPEEAATVKEKNDGSKLAEDVKPKQDTAPESETPEEQTSALETTDEPNAESATLHEENTEEKEKKHVEEVTSEQEISSESALSEEQTPVAVKLTEDLKLEPVAVQKLINTEEKTTVEDMPMPEKPVNKSETAEVKQKIAVENVVLSENSNLSDAPLVESCSSKEANSVRVDPAIEEVVDQAVVGSEERLVEQNDAANKEKGTVEEPLVEECRPECSKVDENPVDAPLPEHSESAQEHTDDVLPEDATNEPVKSNSAEETPERKLESPVPVAEPHESSPEDPVSSAGNSKDDPPPLEDLRSVNNSPASTLVESPYTILETSNEASEVSESSAVSERSTTARIADERRRISTRNILKRKKKLVVLLEPVDIDKLMELSRGSSSSSSPSLERVAMKGSGGSSSESQPAEDGVRAKRLRRDRRTPNSDTVAGDS